MNRLLSTDGYITNIYPAKNGIGSVTGSMPVARSCTTYWLLKAEGKEATERIPKIYIYWPT